MKKLRSFKTPKKLSHLKRAIFMHVEMDPDGTEKIWYFEVKRGSCIEAAGSADDYTTCKSMALECVAENERHSRL